VPTSRVLVDIDGSIAVLTFNRPEARNAMTWEMYERLMDACDRVDADHNVRVFVLRGAGGKAFVSGTDISQFTGFSTRDDVVGYEARLDAVIDRLERVRAATIAQVEGVAAGGGCVIAIACDLRVCTPEARFGVPIARTLGNCLSAANYSRLLDLVGPGRLKDLLFTGRLVDGHEALAIGLANRVVPSASITDTVRELADVIAGSAPLTVQATKEALRRIRVSRRLDPSEVEDLITMCYLSDDFKQAVQAFLGKTTPVFKGR
jgi:enoyl-CoA hydratase/carnithine racemase